MPPTARALACAAALLTGCAPQVSEEVTTQTLRLGDLQIRLDAPQWVSRQSLYPLGITYTNLGTQPLRMSDPFDCGLVWRVLDEATGQVPRPKRQTTYACTTDAKAPMTLAPGESHSGTVSGIIDRFPKGRYRLGAETWQVVAGKDWRKLEPQPQEMRFEIR